MGTTDGNTTTVSASVRRYAKYLMVMAGLGGLLYGIDVGAMAAAFPYLKITAGYTQEQLGFTVSAVLAGSIVGSLVAGVLADIFGRKNMILASSLCFALAIPVICASAMPLWGAAGFWVMLSGRILQGASAGLFGVVVPMYLAECLPPESRGKGTGMFQLFLTIGLVFMAVVGLIVVYAIGASDADIPLDKKVLAWQLIIWASIIPGIALFLGAFRLKESPRWLYKRGDREGALASLASNNGETRAKEILDEIIASDEAEAKAKAELAAKAKGESIFQRKYIVPFVLAVLVLACTQATGVNSALNYSVDIFQQSGLEKAWANWADFGFKVVNVLMTLVAVALVDKKGRTFLLKIGTSGIIVGLGLVGVMFSLIEHGVLASSMTTGLLVLLGFVIFMAFYAVGPGVCVWLALSELMPARIRTNGMAIGMVINQLVSTVIASVLPKWSGACGYSWVFFTLAGFTVIYFITAAFFMPETKGKSLEEIERYFAK